MFLSEAIEHVGNLLDQWPNGRKGVSDGYLGALAAVLMTYPRMVAMKCCKVGGGVARETKFLPTVADLVVFCERETDGMRASLEYEESMARTWNDLHERRELDRQLEAERKKRLTFDELRAKYGPNWGLKSDRKVAPTREESRAALLAAIGQEAFDAIPEIGAEGWRTVGEKAI